MLNTTPRKAMFGLLAFNAAIIMAFTAFMGQANQTPEPNLSPYWCDEYEELEKWIDGAGHLKVPRLEESRPGDPMPPGVEYIQKSSGVSAR